MAAEIDRRIEQALTLVWQYIWQLAGKLGVDPSGLTLRELVWMFDGRRREAWTHTANVMALLANCHRSPKRLRPFQPGRFPAAGSAGGGATHVGDPADGRET